MAKQVYHIGSDKTDVSKQQLLSIRIGERHFGFAISSANAGELYQLVWYTDTEINEIALNEIYAKHPELSRSFEHIFICYDYPQSVLVPMVQYKQDDAKLMLQTMFGISAKDAVITEPVSGWQMHNVYAVPKEVYDWAYRYFPTSNYWHTYTIGIKNMCDNGFRRFTAKLIFGKTIFH